MAPLYKCLTWIELVRRDGMNNALNHQKYNILSTVYTLLDN